MLTTVMRFHVQHGRASSTQRKILRLMTARDLYLSYLILEFSEHEISGRLLPGHNTTIPDHICKKFPNDICLAQTFRTS